MDQAELQQQFEGAQQAQPQQEQQPQAQPDPMELVAQQFGVAPDQLADAIRMQDENRRVYQENRQRKADLDRIEIELAARRQELDRYQPQPYQPDFNDPNRALMEEVRGVRQMLLDERKARIEQEQEFLRVQQMGAELRGEYDTYMRGVPTHSQVDDQRFFGAMAELYPGGVPEGITPGRAVHNVARYLGIRTYGSGNGSAPPQPQVNGIGRRQEIVYAQSPPIPQPNAVSADDADPQPRPGETNDQFLARLMRVIDSAGIRGLKDGQRMSTG